MAKLPANFDWKKSPAHLDLLSKFIKPRNTEQVIDWLYLPATLGENTAEAIDRFVRDGTLIPCELADSVDLAFTAARLKKMLKEQGLKSSGSKEELVERLIEADRDALQRMVSRLKMMICSPQVLPLVEHYKNVRQSDLDIAKQQSFKAFLQNDPKEACKFNITYCHKYSSLASPAYQGGVEWLKFILSSEPKVLGKMTLADWKLLQAAVCMSQLWYGESAVNWLPDDFATNVKNTQIAANYLRCNAAYNRMVASCNRNERVKVVFDSNDIDSCELCLALADKEFDVLDLPELPLVNCTSEQGCKCRLGSAREPGLFFDWIESGENDDEDENLASDGNALDKLRQLKEMLDANLITQKDYDTKKAEILSQL
jgi:hypothetical protein